MKNQERKNMKRKYQNRKQIFGW